MKEKKQEYGWKQGRKDESKVEKTKENYIETIRREEERKG